ncbi:hypothetical protein ACFV5G_13785 [Streptomyces sp. NPDC059766]|uniref:hypothetical protein n=1 Tax=Streptomyces sp. NPDC059766 TaxID=3346940 RepID=UPI003651751F
MNGVPPHIAQVICGHKSLDSAMGYKAIYPAETIEIDRRSQKAAIRLGMPTPATPQETRRQWAKLSLLANRRMVDNAKGPSARVTQQDFMLRMCRDAEGPQA